MKLFKNTLAYVLVACMLLSLMVPVTFAVSAEADTVEYSFTNETELRTSWTGDTKLNEGQVFGEGASQWTYLAYGDSDNKYGVFLNSGCILLRYGAIGNWMAVKLNNVAAGIYDMTFKMDLNQTCDVNDVYILPASVGETRADIIAALATAESKGTLDGYCADYTNKTEEEIARENQTLEDIAFETDGSYILVFKCKETSPYNTTGKSSNRIRLCGLSMTKTADISAEAEAVEYSFTNETELRTSWTGDTKLNEGQVFGEGPSQWTYLAYGDADNKYGVFLNSGCILLRYGAIGNWMAVKLNDVAAGIYDMTFKMDLNPTCDVIDIYILPASVGETRADIIAALATAESKGTLDGYCVDHTNKTEEERARENQTIKDVTFETNGSYILVFKCKEASTFNSTGTSSHRIRICGLSMTKTADVSVEPGGPTDPIDPSNPTDPTNPTDPSNPSDPSVPSVSDGPVDPVVVSTPFAGTFNVGGSDFATAKVNGDDYLYVPIKGGGFYVYNLDTKQKVDSSEDCFSQPRGIAVDKNGLVYVVGHSAFFFRYNPYTGVAECLAYPNDTNTSYDIVYDGENTIYVACRPGYILKYDINTGTFTDFGANNPNSINPIVQYVRSIEYDNGYLYAYVYGVSPEGVTVREIWKMDAATGNVLKTLDISAMALDKDGNPTDVAYLKIVEDVLFGGYTHLDKAFVLDKETLEPAAITGAVDVGMTGTITDVRDGKAYFIGTQARGLHVYDVATKNISPVPGFEGTSKAIWCRIGAFVGSDADPRVGENSIIALTTNKDGIWFYNLDTGETVKWTDLLAGDGTDGVSLYNITKDPEDGTLYIGSYQNPNIVVMDPETYAFETFDNTMAQTDSIMYYDGCIYAGLYSGARLIKYDPDTKEVTVLADLGETSGYDQGRMHTLAAGDGKIFMGTLAFDITKYGHLSWYDLETGELYVEQLGAGTDSKLQYQTIIGLTYHDGLLYGATSIYASNQLEPRSDEGKIFVYDVENKKLLGEFSVDIEGIEKAPYIGAINVDKNGKLWGVVSETLFSFEYDRDSNTMQFTEELSFSKTYYHQHGNTRLWSRPILFEDDGYMYFCFDQNGGMRRINPENPEENILLTKNDLPRKYVMGNDGNLYYVYGNVVKMLPLAQGTPEQDAADAVIELINAIGTVTLESEEAIKAARAAYDALTEEQKAKVSNLDVLTAAETKLAELKAAAEKADADKAAADAVTAKIEAIGSVTLESEEAVNAARAAYDALTEEQKPLVSNLDVLTAAETKLAELKAAAEKADADRAAADAVTAKINTIGTVTPESEEAITAARAAYDALTEDQKALVTNLSVLTDAETKLAELKAAAGQTAADKAAADAVTAKIEAIGTVTLDSEDAIKAARSAYDALTEEQKNLVDTTALTAAEGKLAELKAAAETAEKIRGAKDTVGKALASMSVSNSTTKENIQEVIDEALTKAGITDVTANVTNVAVTAATAEKEGSATITVTFTSGKEDVTTSYNKTVAKLPPAADPENPGTGDQMDMLPLILLMVFSATGITAALCAKKLSYKGKHVK